MNDTSRTDAFTPDFEEFYRREYRSVVTLVYTLTGSRYGAEDLAQDAFIKAHHNWPTVSHYQRPDAWVRVVAMNLARSRLRRLAAEGRALSRFAGMAVQPFPELEPHNERFWAAVRALPHRQCQVVALHYLEDMSVLDIAHVLDIAESTVKNSLAQARGTLAKTLEVAL